jgi:hypothetical protein
MSVVFNKRRRTIRLKFFGDRLKATIKPLLFVLETRNRQIAQQIEMTFVRTLRKLILTLTIVDPPKKTRNHRVASVKLLRVLSPDLVDSRALLAQLFSSHDVAPFRLHGSRVQLLVHLEFPETMLESSNSAVPGDVHRSNLEKINVPIINPGRWAIQKLCREMDLIAY